ncbi:hypothetical protein BKA67DRAFT_647337 [Truncatella angustata]|uniref:Uncharacterized protein n=1 Tax=Truncatella angustata TaxID=152316 RepID=A0A9P8UJ98_9PEZI|nr:uncharacterized protein BKA67DRAFT_647337 [Truncatella angustata]KAH6653453.1 hypothetical protein BKA67DRAFT_647337 [Truncatella angustata]
MADAFCSPTSSGQCTLSIIGTYSSAAETTYPHSFWKNAEVHDSSCKVIGQMVKNAPVFEYLSSLGPFSIDSTLPWTTDITHLSESGDYNAIGMKYGGYNFTGSFDCQLIQDVLIPNPNNQDNVCKHVFPCD